MCGGFDGLIDFLVVFFVFVVVCLNVPAICPWHIGNQSTEHVIDSGPLQISSYVEIGEGVLANQSTEHIVDSGPL